MMCRASLASSREVMSCFGSGRPFEFPNVDLVKPELPRALRHHLCERRLVSGNPLGQHDAGIVGGLNDDAMEQVVDRHLVVDRDEHARRVRWAPPRRHALTLTMNSSVRLEPPCRNLIENHLGRHQLGEAGGWNEIVSRLFKQYAAAVRVDQNGVRGRGLVAVVRLGSGYRIGSSPGCGDAARERLSRRRVCATAIETSWQDLSCEYVQVL